ncbi:MAG: TetR/AcrR family transcriptional regulator [Gemmobacter sp.]|jgi:AcrR family transcriptional regulator|nr:TetR/AcrR family transcriptional regulator [Gemmobacter sp.]
MTDPFDQPDQPDDPLRPREAEILGRIRDTFVEKGFDGASMQQLARAAGMSVGNFYRYFPSKAAMVKAMIRRDLREVEEKFAEVLRAPDPLVALRCGLHSRIAEEGCDDGTLWAEINAAAARKPELAAVVDGMECCVFGHLLTTFARITGFGPEETARRFTTHAAVAVMLVNAVALQRKTGGAAPQDEIVRMIQRLTDVLLDEVASARAGE